MAKLCKMKVGYDSKISCKFAEKTILTLKHFN